MNVLTQSLFRHIHQNQIKKVQTDIIKGADINCIVYDLRNKQQEELTPLKYAIQKRQIEIIELLIHHGANITETKKILSTLDYEFLDFILSEMLTDQLLQKNINLNKCLDFIKLGASLNYKGNPLLSLLKNPHITEAIRLSIIEDLLLMYDLNEETIKLLKVHESWVKILSKILYSFIEPQPDDEESFKLYKTHIARLIFFGARYDIPMPFESPRMFLFDEEMNKMETAWEKAKELNQLDIMSLMQSRSIFASINVNPFLQSPFSAK